MLIKNINILRYWSMKDVFVSCNVDCLKIKTNDKKKKVISEHTSLKPTSCLCNLVSITSSLDDGDVEARAIWSGLPSSCFRIASRRLWISIQRFSKLSLTDTKLRRSSSKGQAEEDSCSSWNIWERLCSNFQHMRKSWNVNTVNIKGFNRLL